MEPVQGLNLNCRYILGLEPEMPVTNVMPQEAVDLCHMYLISTSQSRYGLLPFSGASQNFGRRLLASSCLSACLPVCPSVRPYGTARLPLDRFS